MGETLHMGGKPPSAPPPDKWRDAGVRAGDVIAGRYRVDDILGVGGMGVVIATTHAQLGTRFAVKMMRLHQSALMGDVKKLTERFLREARAASRLTSPHAARVFDVGQSESGTPYMVMELLEGEDLKTMQQRLGALDPTTAARYVIQACDALAEAHAAGIVHRDLKPANLFFTKSGSIKVLDFGISKFVAATSPEDAAPLTNPETTLGSPKYMAPEQLIRPNEVDARADLWSLGVTLYELIVGQSPFRGETDEYVARAVMVEFPLPPSLAKNGIPEALSTVVMRCLEKDKAARYASASELAQALDGAIGPAPTITAPPQFASAPPPPAVPTFDPPRATAPSLPPIPKKRPSRAIALVSLSVTALAGVAFFAIWRSQQRADDPPPPVTLTPPPPPRSAPITLGTLSAPEPTLAPTDSTPLTKHGSVTEPKVPKKQPDPLCFAANVVCQRSYPECQPLKDYCEGKAHAPPQLDSGAGAPNETPICTAARIVCDHKLEECDSLTKKCLIAQMTP